MDIAKIIYRFDSTKPLPIWDAFATWYQKQGWKGVLSKFGRREANLRRAIELNGKWYFEQTTEAIRFHLGRCRGPSYAMDQILAYGLQEIENSIWHSFVMQLAKEASFVHALVVDEQYDAWQNTKDINSYIHAGRPYLHLPQRINELQPPLNFPVIDTRRNPGRYVHRDHHLEALGGIMWFSEDFFTITGADKKTLLQVPFIKAEDCGGILKITLDEDLLADAEGDEEMANKQNILRAILYPKTGILCDS